MFVSLPQIPMVKSLPPNVMVFGGKAFGRKLDLDEVMKVGPPDGISALTRRELNYVALSPSWEDMVKK